MRYGVYKVDWLESERGMGMRPDGYSLHASYDIAKQYIEEKDERGKLDRVPEYYVFTWGEPEFVEVDQQTADQVEREGSIRYSR